MKAVVHEVYGPPEVLRVAELDRPVPGPDEVLIQVHAAGVDPGVWHATAGLPYLLRLTPFRLRRGAARVRGMDVAGRVEAVGAQVTGVSPGDTVFGSCDGSFAEYVCARPERLAHLPAGLDFAHAAVVAVSGCTALQALRDTGRLRAGQSVLVLGAAGGVGAFAVQVAKALGAGWVTAVCGPGQEAFVRALGADEALDYTRDEPADRDRRYDVVLDIAGHRPLTGLRRVLAPGGTVVMVGAGTDGRWLGGLDRQLRGLLLSLLGGRRRPKRFRMLFSTQRAADLRQLADLIAAGRLTPPVARCFSLTAVPQALRRLREGGLQGKIAIVVREEA
ncbi:NAD(P)-dependent alcohol dehydrogenase [Streptacidiphilus rugosus]|uniref:NAD(P)-dependent alcohol dehydrogenase n=1 Tax=Streptacidiphilus rugosus TaxID=405783 RepID=UPI000564F38A|nr:NAD(P)-dependent alcohol dehydrogenase [Streptacidiphilus rugosus]